MLYALLPIATTVVLTRSRHDRAAALDVLAETLAGRSVTAAVEMTVGNAIGRSLARAGPDDVVLVTGSLFIVGEAIEAADAELPTDDRGQVAEATDRDRASEAAAR